MCRSGGPEVKEVVVKVVRVVFAALKAPPSPPILDIIKVFEYGNIQILIYYVPSSTETGTGGMGL